MTSSPRNLVSTLLAAGVLAAPSFAGSTSAGFTQHIFEPEEPAIFAVTGDPGDLVYLIIGSRLETTFIPEVGTIGIALGPGTGVKQVGTLDGSGELDVTCGFGCGALLADDPGFLQAVTVDPVAGVVSGVSEVGVLQIATTNCDECAQQPTADSFATGPGGIALDLPGCGSFVFDPDGQFSEFADGTAILTGFMVNTNDSTQKLSVCINFSGRVSVGDANHPPAGGPVLDLMPSAYFPSGPILADNWRYYPSASGKLIGFDALDGAKLTLANDGNLQVGLGASGKNVQMGASAAFDVTVDSNPTSGPALNCDAASLCMNVGVECPDVCAEPAAPDSSVTTNVETTALYLYNFCTDFEYVSGGEWVEAVDGTARFEARVACGSDPSKIFDIVLDFSCRSNPGAPSYPPAGSPKKELLDDTAYLENGGPVDTDQWYYYECFTGTLTGQGCLAGAVIEIERFGPAFQVGVGASLKNLDYGGSGWFSIDIVSPSTGGCDVPTSLHTGDFNLTFGDCQ